MPVKKEKEIRKELFEYARKVGAEQDLQELFNKWDKLIALAPPNERMEMSRMAILEVQDLLDITRAENFEGLTINGETVLPPRKNDY